MSPHLRIARPVLDLSRAVAQYQQGLGLEELARFRSTPVTTMTLFALDAETGKQLYSSGKLLSGFTHFTQPVVALGKVFLVDHDSHVYAFGLK